ncbi:hypothetical protein [Niabella sp.]|uniref:hypothetical protein n=1 Tax=Niabella sp. TaxID=1962976 RepID=UPI002616569B|nr:hypothetical protein [Niabella sp.]
MKFQSLYKFINGIYSSAAPGFPIGLGFTGLFQHRLQKRIVFSRAFPKTCFGCARNDNGPFVIEAIEFASQME